ncbi:ornithine carbamoyltransferase [Verrucomicrobia bacterium]|nr:ornithine carbamoyltransferase [Verrucomicrobiota bacterium]
MKHLLSLEDVSQADFETIMASTTKLKAQRPNHPDKPLDGQTWALIFSKSSTRTRVSFEAGVYELGGRPMFLSARDIQLGRGEPIKDTARVLGRMIHGAIIRTFAQQDVEEFAEFSGIPTVNALTDYSHPCQILTDIFTFQEARGSIAGKTVTFVGDAACNVCTSWIIAAGLYGFKLRVAAPEKYLPLPEIIEKGKGNVECFTDIRAASEGSDLLYTDVWVSMGQEDDAAERIADLSGYQLNKKLVEIAAPEAQVMHCLPAYRGKEIDEETLEAHASTIFTEAENRLHTQKAIMQWMVS